MKQAILIAALFLAPFIYSQNAPIDFESGGNGASWTWTVFENVANLPLEIVANPDPTGANTSATVAKFTALQAGQPYAGCESLHGADIGTFSIDATNSIVKIMVWKTETSDVGIKFSKADGWSMGEIKMPNTVTNAWEEITFNFSAQVESGYDQIVIFPDFQARAQDNIIYFDNITFSAPTAPTEPTVAAPTPTQDPADVISIYSGTYTDIAGTDFNPGWGQTTIVSFVEIVGNETMKYETFNYQGIQLAANQELSEMEFMHLDIWTPDATVVKTTPISATTGEFLLELTPLNQGVWNSYDIPVGDFAGVSMADIHQLKFDGQAGVNPSNLFIDNIYFWKNTTTATEPAVAAPTPTQDPADVISIYSGTYTDIAGTDFNPGWGQTTIVSFVEIVGNETMKYETFNYQGIQLAANQELSEMEFMHLDIWTPDATVVKTTPISATTGEFLLELTPLNQGVWNSYDIPVGDFAGVSMADIHQLKFDGQAGVNPSNLFIDNIYFYKVPTTATEPTVAAPTPTQDPVDVISMFSDAYTDISVDTWLTPWSDATLEDVMIDGNPTKKYSNMNFIGIETVGPNLIDASTMTYFHMDVWTPDANDFKIKLVDFGADAAFGGGDDSEHELVFTAPVTGSWISYDIPIADFTGLLNTDHIAQLIMVKAPLGTIFVDNVFYYKDPFVLPEPTVAAPTPTQDPGNVISMFSDVYTDVPVDTWLTSWSDATLEDVMIDGNPTKKYTEVNVIGIETTGANLIDASNMTSIHIDFWTPDANDFKIKLVDFGADAAFGGGDDSEHELVFTAPATETWVSYNIPLVLFTNLLSREHLAQLIFSKAPMGTLYIDNVYYYNPTLGTAEFDMLEMNVFPNPTTNLWNFTSNHSIENILVYDVVGKTVIFVSPNANEVSINASSINEGIYFAKIKTTSGITEIKLIKK